MAKAERVTCFVSYCHDGLDRATLDYVLHVLHDGLGPAGQLLVDDQVKVGGDFSDFMALLDVVDTVVVVLTPAYKRKVLERDGGVYSEFRKIWTRYSDGADQPTRHTDDKPARFELLPILLSGSPSQSIPDELVSLKYLDLTRLHVVRKPTGEFQVSQKVLSEVMPKLAKLALQIRTTASVGSEAFRALSKTYYDRLFVDLKAKFDDPEFATHDYLKTILVRTHSYKRIDNQVAFWVVGRKGSGKSTLAQVLPLMRATRYQAVLRFTVDDLNLELLYSLYGDEQFSSDVTRAVSRYQAFQFTWEAVLMLGAMSAMVEQSASLSDVQRKALRPVRAFMDRLPASPGKSSISRFFPFAFAAMVQFVRDCIDGAQSNPAFFLMDIDARFERQRYLSSVFGEPVLAAFLRVLQSLDSKFLVTIDGFDSVFEGFRAASASTDDRAFLQRRTEFEVDWLRALLSLTIWVKDHQQHYFYNLLDFCVTVPKDRFIEARRKERDSYRFWHRWATLNWSGVELAILLRKRLEVLADDRTRKDTSPRDRLDEILRHKAFRGLPHDVQFEYNGRSYTLPLFMYVLRHTFWRPREVLMYYAALLALADDMRRWNHEVTVDAVRNCVKAQTTHVIESEFIGEFQNMVNIAEVISAFRRQRSVLSFDEVRETLTGADFRFAAGEGAATLALAEKVKFLYEVGFLGIRADPSLARELGLNLRDAFCFNEGTGFIQGATEEEMRPWTFLVHPVFSEYLRLDTRQQDLSLPLTWDYLHVQEAFLAANPQM